MSFSAEWLDLRAGADARARNRAIETAMIEALPEVAVRVLDLGSGTGANLAALAPGLGRAQVWTLADNDAALLKRVTAPAGVGVDCKVADLSGDLSGLFDPAPDLVTASAFFDLCGAQMVDALVRQIAGAGAIFYTVLSYDGRESWSPPHPLDGAILDAFHRDQQRDKGLGPALGPEATAYLMRAFITAGYKVRTGPSDWVLERDSDQRLIEALAHGSAAAVAHDVPGAESWAEERARAERVVIGHQDLLAVPG